MYYYLVIGSNIDPKTNIGFALEYLCQEFGRILVHPRVITKPWNVEGNQEFINTAVEFTSLLNEAQIKERCRHIEELLGRPRNMIDRKTKDRTCDIDICGALAQQDDQFWRTQTAYFICAIFDETSHFSDITINQQPLIGQYPIMITSSPLGKISISTEA